MNTVIYSCGLQTAPVDLGTLTLSCKKAQVCLANSGSSFLKLQPTPQKELARAKKWLLHCSKNGPFSKEHGLTIHSFNFKGYLSSRP